MAADPVTQFAEALWKGDRATVTRLAPKVDPDGRDRWGRAVLAMAAQYGDVALVAKLLARGAGADAGRVHATPLAAAAKRGDKAIIAALRKAGAGRSLVADVWLGGRVLLRRLAKEPRVASIVDEDGTPLLHHAAEADALAIVGALIAAGASVEAGDTTGETALHRAADRRGEGDPTRVLELLLARGADVNARTHDGVTPLHQAVRARNLAAVTALLAHGADPNARDKRGSTPLHRAVASTGASNTAGTAALMPALARALVAAGADPDLRDARGRSARAAARAADVRAALG